MKQRITHASNVGRLTALIGLLLLAPLLVLPFFPEDAPFAAAFLIPGIASILVGLALCLCPPARPLTMQEAMHHGNLLVLYIWLYGCLAGALPFVLGGRLTFVQALFEAVSGWTTTGLSVMDVTVTPPIFLFYRSFMQFCGGAGSTAGGIKLSRTLIMLKASFAELRARVSPEHEVRTPSITRAQGKSPVDAPTLRATAGFVTLYLLLFAAGTLLLCITEGAPLASCMFEFASSLGTVGLSIGLTGPATRAATLLVEIAGMLLGRLEILLVFTGLGSAVFLMRQRRRR